LKISLGSYGTAGQLQQRPSPAGGGIFKRHWFRYWQPRGANLPPIVVRLQDGTLRSIEAIEAPHRVDEQIQSWDCSFNRVDRHIVDGGESAKSQIENGSLQI
jgi:hypothetical protein